MSAWDIPLFDLDYGVEEIAAVTAVLESQWLTMGERIQAFEREFAAFIGVSHAIAMNNCTAGLHAAYVASGVRPGDEVIVPSLTFVATVNAIIAAGATPVFADITSSSDMSVSPRSVERAITAKTRAIAVLHYAGFPCAITEIRALANAKGLALIEDCAHAPGASAGGRMLGAWGDAAAFSFFSNKNLSTGEGGMVTTNDDEIARRLRLLRSHGMTSLTLDRHKGHAFTYDVLLAGHNYRMDEMHAALGSVQLAKLLNKNERRRVLTEHYRQLVRARLLNVSVPFAQVPLHNASCHIFVVLLPEGTDRSRLMKQLAAERIQSSVHYLPAHRFSFYRDTYPGVSLPDTEAVAGRILTLPLFPSMTTAQVEHVVEVLNQSL